MNVAVFHPGTQHSWQTALALQQLGRLEWYATSIFYQADRWPYKVERFLPGALSRRVSSEFRRFAHPGLDGRLVRTSGLTEWFERIAARCGQARMARWLDRFGNDRFVSAIERDLRSPDPFALWGYSGSSETSFALARTLGRACILDRTNGDFRVYNRMMAQIREKYGDWFLPTELQIPETNIQRDHREYELANRILVGSPFAADTLREATGDPAITAKVQVLNYCFDEALFRGLPAPAPARPDEPVRFLFLGLVIPRKGIQHVLEALARIPRSAAELTIVGSMKVPAKAFAPYADRVTYLPTVARADVPRIMAAHHVFLLPSYFEGAGITLYEALAAGNALIQSDRCTPAVTPETGILLDRVDTDSVYAAMMQAIEDRERLNAWRSAAQGRAQAFSFRHYRENIAALLDEMGL